MKLLALDTSTEALAIGVCAPQGRFTLDAPGGAAASATLLPQIETLLGRAGLKPADLDAIAFGRGPGAFTGLRTSCAVAQGLAFGLAKPVLPLDSLLVVAEDARAQLALEDEEGELVVAMDARMDEVYAARYAWSAGGAWVVLSAPALYTLEAFAVHLAAAPAAAVAGSALAAFAERLARPPGARPVPAQRQRAAALLRLAEQAHAAGAGVDAAGALPLYLRDKVALTTAERNERNLRRLRTAPAEAPMPRP
jgi:tRNA threonylcarbamoyladenosine biosynthesis protein TsaB